MSNLHTDQLYFGVDIGGTATKIGAFDPHGNLLSKWEIKTDVAQNGALILPNVAEEILHYARNLSRVVAIGGGVSKAGDYLIETVKKHYETLSVLSERKAAVALAKLGNDAGIYGAAKLAMDSVR